MNILGHDEEDRVRETYGAAFTRVQAVNATYDAANAFVVNPNLRPPAQRNVPLPRCARTAHRYVVGTTYPRGRRVRISTVVKWRSCGPGCGVPLASTVPTGRLRLSKVLGGAS